MDDRIEADASVGRLDGAAFARSILDAAVTSYFEAVDAIEAEVDRLDARSLRSNPDDDLLADLVALRRRVARLRRALSAHREVYATLASADFSKIAEGEDVRTGFVTVAGRFEDAIHSVEDSRDLLLGSFDVFMTRTAQRTNDVMKVLALATVLLLPGSLIAGLLGMNVVVPLPKDDPVSFWLVGRRDRRARGGGRGRRLAVPLDRSRFGPFEGRSGRGSLGTGTRAGGLPRSRAEAPEASGR